MKIAVVGPSPIPFVIGGNENLLCGVYNALNQLTNHQVELIKVPVKEDNFWNLIESYYKFYQLDLSHFDLIISTKYPSWMIRHHNSICYMVHTLRGLYDTYASFQLGENIVVGNKYIDAVLEFMDYNPSPIRLDEFFELIFSLKDRQKSGEIPLEYFAFPAPFIRKLVHYMDRWGLSQSGVQKYCAISQTVKNRTSYFPQGASVQVIYPPSMLKEYQYGNYEYIFMISRLDAPKRLDMLIEAMRYVKSDIRLYIAGTGPEGGRLRSLAINDKRIHFLGYITDEEAEQYYSNALVVPYFPYDEDLGLITLEAMMHKKPVITTCDAGGPREFVVDGETGFVTDFDAKAIAEKIDYMACHKADAKLMGENARKSVEQITWQSVADKLLDLNLEEQKKRKKIVATTTFSVWPPQGGGQARMYYLHKALSKYADVELQILSDKSTSNKLGKGYYECCTAKSIERLRIEKKMDERAGIPATDIEDILLTGLTPEYGRRLKASIEDSDIVFIEPYLYREAESYLDDKVIIYEALNVEYTLKKNMLPETEDKERLLEAIYLSEKECCERSEWIMACSEEDKIGFCDLYGVSPEKIIVVPNGVDCAGTVYTSPLIRQIKKMETGLGNEKIGLFMGSWHGPNLEACEYVIRIARNLPEVKFLLMGSQCAYLIDQKIPLPRNVGLLGLVSEEEKSKIFTMVDFALNPMVSGSGTNLKMFDYMAAGIPVITTKFGARGIEDLKVMTVVAEPMDMVNVIRDWDAKKAMQQAADARKYMETQFDWNIIAEFVAKKLQ